MMFDAPRISQAAWSIVACMFCIAATAFVPRGFERVERAFYLGAIAFALLAVVIIVLIMFRAGEDRLEAMERFIRAYANLDDEGRAAIALQFPTLRYRMRRGRVREMWEDTNIPIETFRLFLQDSNRKYIAPERNWNSTERPRAAWEEIRVTLESAGFVQEDSAAGSHSWLWNGNAYDHLIAYWMAGRDLRDLNADEFQNTPI